MASIWESSTKISHVKPFSTILRADVKIISPSIPKIPNICFIYLVYNRDPAYYDEKKLSRKSTYHKSFVIELFLDSLASINDNAVQGRKLFNAKNYHTKYFVHEIFAIYGILYGG